MFQVMKADDARAKFVTSARLPKRVEFAARAKFVTRARAALIATAALAVVATAPAQAQSTDTPSNVQPPNKVARSFLYYINAPEAILRQRTGDTGGANVQEIILINPDPNVAYVPWPLKGPYLQAPMNDVYAALGPRDSQLPTNLVGGTDAMLAVTVGNNTQKSTLALASFQGGVPQDRSVLDQVPPGPQVLVFTGVVTTKSPQQLAGLKTNLEIPMPAIIGATQKVKDVTITFAVGNFDVNGCEVVAIPSGGSTSTAQTPNYTKCPGQNLVKGYFRTNADAEARGMNLQNANFSKANLKKADMRGARLSNANLSGADLTRANLRGAITNGTKLSNAKFCKTTMPDGSKRGSGDC
jgi:hypothetical protein